MNLHKFRFLGSLQNVSERNANLLKNILPNIVGSAEEP